MNTKTPAAIALWLALISVAHGQPLVPAAVGQSETASSAEQVLSRANIPSLDPHTMTSNEIEDVLGSGPLCTYHYTTAGNPILAFNESPDVGDPGGVVKLNGTLIVLSAIEVERGFGFSSGSVRLTVVPEEPSATDEQEEAVLRFEIGDQLTVGYLGYLECA